MTHFPSYTVVTNLGYQLAISHHENRRSFMNALCMCGNIRIYEKPTLTTCCDRAICPSCFKNAKKRRISIQPSGIKFSIFFKCPWCNKENSPLPYHAMKLMDSESTSRISSLKVICCACPQTELLLDKADTHIVTKHDNIKPKKKKNARKQLYYRECISRYNKPDTDTISLSSRVSFVSAFSLLSTRSVVHAAASSHHVGTNSGAFSINDK